MSILNNIITSRNSFFDKIDYITRTDKRIDHKSFLLKNFFYQLYIYIFTSGNKFKIAYRRTKVGSFLLTKNQASAAQPILDKLDSFLDVSLVLPGSENKIILRLRIIAYYLFQILTSALVPKKIGILLDHRTFIAWLKYEQASSFFRKKPIRVLLIGNDHVSLFRAVILAAKENAIKTIYIPHASVGPHFPPLDFDFALLEGEEMKRIYLNIGKTTTNYTSYWATEN